LPLCPPQAPRFLTQAPIPDLLERPVTNRWATAWSSVTLGIVHYLCEQEEGPHCFLSLSAGIESTSMPITCTVCSFQLPTSEPAFAR
jgi:hypothetical protein